MMDHENLAKILKYLSKEELVKVVEEDDRLLPIARRVFTEKFSNYIVVTNEYRFSMFKINKAFEKVTYLALYKGNICNAATDISVYFPNMVLLQLNDLKSEIALYGKMFGSCCPKLKSLKSANIITTNGSDLGWKIAKIVALNPQLEC